MDSSTATIRTFKVSAVAIGATGSPADRVTMRIPFDLTHWRVLRAWVGVATAVGTLAASFIELRSKADGRGLAFTSALAASDLTAAGKMMAFALSANTTISTGRDIVVRQTVNSANAGTVDIFVEVAGSVKVVALPSGYTAFWDASDPAQLPGADGATAGNWTEPVGGRTITWVTPPTVKVNTLLPGGRAAFFASTDGSSNAISGITTEASIIFIGAADGWGTCCPAGLTTGITNSGFWAEFGLGLNADINTPAQIGSQGHILTDKSIEYNFKGVGEGNTTNDTNDYAMYYALRRKSGGLVTCRYNNVKIVDEVQQPASVTNLPSVLRVGRMGGQSYFPGYVFGIIVYPRAVTDAELDDIARFIRLKWGILADYGNLYAHGTSITAGIGGTRESSWCNRIYRDLRADGYGLRYANGGVGGGGAAPGWGSGHGRQQRGYFDSHNLYVLDHGTNDISAYDDGRYTFVDAASTTSHLCVLANVENVMINTTAGALGVGWQVAATCPLQRQAAGTVTNMVASNVTYGQWVRDNYVSQLGAAVLLDWENGIPSMNMSAGVLPPAYFADAVHPNIAGQALMFGYCTDAIRNALAIPLTPNPS